LGVEIVEGERRMRAAMGWTIPVLLLALTFPLHAAPAKLKDFSAAVKDNKTEAVRAYLAAGGNPNATEGDRNLTLLHWAAFHGSFDVVKLLVAKGATVNAHAKKPDWMPLHYASHNAHTAVVLHLLDNGGQLEGLTDDFAPPLAMAASGATSHKKMATVRALLDRGADGARALMYAARKNRADIITLLLDSGVSVNATPQTKGYGETPGETALTQAVEGGHLELVTLLLDRGANPNVFVPNVNMPTPLTMAAYYCDSALIDLLIARGALRSTTNSGGSTAADLAASGWTDNMKPCSPEIVAKLR